MSIRWVFVTIGCIFGLGASGQRVHLSGGEFDETIQNLFNFMVENGPTNEKLAALKSSPKYDELVGLATPVVLQFAASLFPLDEILAAAGVCIRQVNGPTANCPVPAGVPSVVTNIPYFIPIGTNRCTNLHYVTFEIDDIISVTFQGSSPPSFTFLIDVDTLAESSPLFPSITYGTGTSLTYTETLAPLLDFAGMPSAFNLTIQGQRDGPPTACVTSASFAETSLTEPTSSCRASALNFTVKLANGTLVPFNCGSNLGSGQTCPTVPMTSSTWCQSLCQAIVQCACSTTAASAIGLSATIGTLSQAVYNAATPVCVGEDVVFGS